VLGCHNFSEKNKNVQKMYFFVTFLSLLMKIQLQTDFKKCHFRDFCHFWPSAFISDLYNWFGCCHWVMKLITLSKKGTSLYVRRFGGVAWKLPNPEETELWRARNTERGERWEGLRRQAEPLRPTTASSLLINFSQKTKILASKPCQLIILLYRDAGSQRVMRF